MKNGQADLGIKGNAFFCSCQESSCFCWTNDRKCDNVVLYACILYHSNIT